MNVAGVIEQYNTEYHNSVEDNLKISWIKKCEMMIINDTILTHEDAPSGEFLDEHINTFDINTELLVPEPYDDIYIHYLAQRTAMNNNDLKMYNTSSELYNNVLLKYKQKYNREHKGLMKKSPLLRHEVL